MNLFAHFRDVIDAALDQLESVGTLPAGQPMSSKANRMDLMELETKEMLTKKKCKIESAR